MLNHITLAGRLVADPELRRTQSGIAVASFNLAVDQDYKAQNGERGVDFIPIVAWRGTAEFAEKYFEKGQMAIVSGRLSTRRYEDKNGNKRTAYEVVASNIYFAGSKAKSNTDEAPQRYDELLDDDPDLPF
jgi:single-strand DNA-binding protein